MNKEFVLRGQTASGGTEVLNFSGNKPGYAYRLVEFQVYPSELANASGEYAGTITAGKTAVAPITGINFNDEGLIGTTYLTVATSPAAGMFGPVTVINDTFRITQNLILMVQEANSSALCNWQCRFVAEKMDGSEEAAANYKQFTIFDG